MKRIAMLAGVLLFACPAWAGDVDLTAPIRDLAGAVVPSSNVKDAPPMTVGLIIEQALSLQTPPPGQDPGAAATTKLSAFSLALRVHSATRMSFTAEEISQIKTAVAQVYPSPIVLGRIVEVIDPAAIKPEPAK